MSEAIEPMLRLEEFAVTLDKLGRELGDTERALVPLEEKYETFVENYETGLWDKHDKEGAKLPSEAMRLKLAHRAMDPELLGAYNKLVRKRGRLQKRIANLKASVSACQSILSALKVEAEASGGGIRRAA